MSNDFRTAQEKIVCAAIRRGLKRTDPVTRRIPVRASSDVPALQGRLSPKSPAPTIHTAR